MADSFKAGNVNWERFFDVVVGLIDTTTEAIVAEIVDNSIDHLADNIQVELTGRTRSDFHIVVYDDGVGFDNSKNLEMAFDLAVENIGKQEKIGKFHIGMKLTPLSNCQTVSVFSKTKDGIIHRSIDKKEIQNAKQYGTTSDIRSGSIYKTAKKKLLDSEFTTAVILSNFDTEPFSLSYNEKSVKKYASHLKQFLGLVYEPLLLGYAPERKVPDIEVVAFGNEYEVLALDPFWKEFTPRKLMQRIDLPSNYSSAILEEDKERIRSLAEFGTIRTVETPVVINAGPEFGNKQDVVKVSAFAYPLRTVRSKFPNRYKKNVIGTGPSGSGSLTLNADRMGGFYFYRNGRCVCFGDTGVKSSGGWYGLKSSIAGIWARVRFEIVFPSSLDKYMGLSPTKDKVNPRKDATDFNFFDQIKPALMQIINEPLLRSDLGTNGLPFYNPDDEGNSVSGKDATKEKYKKINSCPHCGNYHLNIDLCLEKICENCGILKCRSGDCKYQCTQCDVPGHLEKDCPKNCKYCVYPNGAGGHDGEICPLLCDSCGQVNCDGPCNDCNNCNCECLCPDCGKKGLPCSCKNKVLSEPIKSGEDVLLIEVDKRSRDASIANIKQAMDFLGLQIEDLE